jgi:membrane protease YdiL (CAAX protease family)
MGKIFAITGSVIFLLVYKKFELKDYFITFHQNKEHLKKALITVLVVFTVATVMNVTFSSPREWNVESIAYQLTMPGLNEEIVYRGILLGLLVKILNPNSFLHPAILATALLFGMAHGLILNESYEVVFKAQAFFETMIMGMIWAWVTLKTGSIMLALLSHNLGNASGHLISMIK